MRRGPSQPGLPLDPSFGETLSDLVTPSDLQPAVSAVLRTGTETISCRLWLGEPVATPTSGSVFAVKSRSGWIVATADDRPAGEVFKIKRLEAHPATDRRRVVAVLDDDPSVTDSIVASFEDLGYSAHPFYTAPDLLKSAATTAFDCFVLDWVIDDGTVLELVRSLRAAHDACPIVILTAQMSSGAINETDIADAMKHYDLLFCEKPVRTSILAAMLSSAFASRSDPDGPVLRRRSRLPRFPTTSAASMVRRASALPSNGRLAPALSGVANTHTIGTTYLV